MVKEFIKRGDLFETSFLTGAFHSRNHADEQEFVVKNVTFKCDVGEFRKGEQLETVYLFANISDDGSELELIVTEPERGDRFSRIFVKSTPIMSL